MTGIRAFLLGALMTSGALAAEDARFEQVHSKDKPHIVPLEFADRAAWEKRAEFVRTQAKVALGLWPMPEKTALNPVIHGAIDRDAYTIEKVYFASLPGHYVTGNLYRPKNKTGKLPVVLAPFGHWPDGRFWWRSDVNIQKELDSGAEVDPIAARSPLQANCAMLARMGCVVFQYDMVGFNDSQQIPHREGFLDAESILRLQSFMGLQTWNSIRSLDFVLSLPEVDSTRVGVMGSSSGGSQAIALNAVDDRVTASFPMAMVSMNMQGGCVCENAPLYRVLTNNVELASLVAPKPQSMPAGNDWTVDFLKRGLPEMKAIWKLYDAENQVEGAHYNYGHNHNLHGRQQQYNFFNRVFKLGLPEPVKEQPFQIVPAKELSVWDDTHKLPADATGATEVRAWFKSQSDAALAKMSDADRKQAVLAALHAMVVDQMPSPDGVITSNPLPKTDNWHGTISRKDAGEQVPCHVFIPNELDGTAIVSVSDSSDTTPKLNPAKTVLIRIAAFKSDAFKSELKPAPATQRGNPNPPYLGYVVGYDRSTLANRAHDLMTAIALARQIDGVKSVKIVGSGKDAPAALLAAALAGDAVDQVAINLEGFDFDQIKQDSDPMLLPGALKYGGVKGFMSLIDPKKLVAETR